MIGSKRIRRLKSSQLNLKSTTSWQRLFLQSKANGGATMEINLRRLTGPGRTTRTCAVG